MMIVGSEKFYWRILTLVVVLVLIGCTNSDSKVINNEATKLSLVKDGLPNAIILIDTNEETCVRLAGEDLKKDIFEISGATLPLTSKLPKKEKNIIVIGTLENSRLIQRMVKEKLLNTDELEDQWEGYIVRTLKNPFPGIGKMLVIAGSDKRGAMWGVYTFCEEYLGIDPLKMWTETKPEHKSTISLPDLNISDSPSIRYRGVFINDEMSLLNWSMEKWGEPTRAIAHEVHEMIVETLLRLKGNLYCVPMKGEPLTEKDLKLIHNRGVYHTASHHEILLAKTLTKDWDAFCIDRFGETFPYSITRHKDKLELFFRKAIQKHKDIDNVWPVGIRGSGDRPFWISDPYAPESMEERVKVVAEGTEWQLQLLAEEIGKEQYNHDGITITFYSEMRTLFDTGSFDDLPPEVIFVWPDNNAGTLRIPENVDQTRKQGIYTHITFCTNQNVQWVSPVVIKNEFKRLENNNIKDYYLVNVGDLRENLLGTEMSLVLAWDPSKAVDGFDLEFLSEWSQRYFGEQFASEISVILKQYFEMANPVMGSMSSGKLLQNQYAWSINMINNTSELWSLFGSLHDYWTEDFENNLNWLEEQQVKWNELNDKARNLETRLTGHEQHIFFDQVLFHISCHRTILNWNLNLHRSVKALANNNVIEAKRLLHSSYPIFEELDETMDRNQSGFYRGWFKNEPELIARKLNWGAFSGKGLSILVDELVQILDTPPFHSIIFDVDEMLLEEQNKVQNPTYHLPSLSTEEDIWLLVGFFQNRGKYPYEILFNSHKIEVDFSGSGLLPFAHYNPEMFILKIKPSWLKENQNKIEVLFNTNQRVGIYSIKLIQL